MRRFLTALAALLFAGAAHAQVLTTPPISYPLLAPNGGPSAPSYNFAASTNTGVYSAGVNTMTFGVAGAARFHMTTGAFRFNSAASMSWTSTSDPAGTIDLSLYRDAANTLALRNGAATPQIFRVYNDYTDSSNYERGILGWASNTFYVGTDAAGTGTGRPMVLRSSGVDRWRVENSGNFTASTDNTLDIGATASGRPRNVYIADSITAGNAINGGNGGVVTGGAVTIGSSNALRFTTNSRIKSGVNGRLELYNQAETDFTSLTFGGTTASFPSLKRSGTELQVRTADDGGSAPFRAQYVVTSGSYLVSGLPVCVGSLQGARAFVTDATAPTFLGALTGGGAVVAPVFCNGSAWVAG